MQTILLVEDDEEIIRHLTKFLQDEHFQVISVTGQRDALKAIEEKESMIDLVLLDISLAEGNGFAVCAAIKSNTDIPVVFLTASGDEYSTVTGLDMGADDYIAKPFRPRELMSRIRNVLRRTGKSNSILKLANVSIDANSGTVQKNGSEILLSALEYRLLLIFANHKGQVLSRNQLLDEIWDVAGDFVNDNTLTVYIKRLREKIEDDPGKPKIIKTIRGLGYRAE